LLIEQAIDGGGTAHHSSTDFDDATLPATIYSIPLTLSPLPDKPVLAKWQVFASWDVPFIFNFPPRANSVLKDFNAIGAALRRLPKDPARPGRQSFIVAAKKRLC